MSIEENKTITKEVRSFQRQLLIAKLEAEMLDCTPPHGDIEWRKGWNTRAQALIDFLRSEESPVHERFDLGQG